MPYCSELTGRFEAGSSSHYHGSHLKVLAEAGMAKRSTARASPEIEKLKAANLAYYKALSARDIRAMAQVWTCARNNILIAPPENPHEHIGWTAIKRNWERY